MKATRDFNERFQGMKFYKKGDEYTFKDVERVDYLVQNGYLEKPKEKTENGVLEVELENLKKVELISFIELNLNDVEVPTKHKSEKVADYEGRLRNFIFENLESGD